MSNVTTKPEAEVVGTFATAAAYPQLLQLEHPNSEIGSVPVLVCRTAHGEIRMASVKEHIDQYRTRPEFREGVATLYDLDSFIAHTKRFASAASALFACPTPTAPSLQSVLDYHAEGASSEPSRGQHRGVYAFPLSDEWKRWNAQAGQKMTQAEFAEFLEANIVDLADPSGELGATAAGLAEAAGITFAGPSKILDLSRGLSVKAGQQVKQAVNLGTGEITVSFVETHLDDNGAPLKVPGGFLVALPVFRNGAPYRLPVRLRYRVAGGQISWFFELYRADRVFDHAFNEACEKAMLATELPLFVGSPE